MNTLISPKVKENRLKEFNKEDREKDKIRLKKDSYSYLKESTSKESVKVLTRDSSSVSSLNISNNGFKVSSLSAKPTIKISGLSVDINKYKNNNFNNSINQNSTLKIEKTPNLIESKLLGFKKGGNSLSTSSLLKQYKQMTNLSKSGNSIIGSSINLSQHKRTGSTSSASNNLNKFKY